jgi:hypothetical protein
MSAMIRAFVPTSAGAKPAKAAETADRRQRQTLLRRYRRRRALCGGRSTAKRD